jgi:hypothetical protein
LQRIWSEASTYSRQADASTAPHTSDNAIDMKEAVARQRNAG